VHADLRGSSVQRPRLPCTPTRRRASLPRVHEARGRRPVAAAVRVHRTRVHADLCGSSVLDFRARRSAAAARVHGRRESCTLAATQRARESCTPCTILVEAELAADMPCRGGRCHAVPWHAGAMPWHAGAMAFRCRAVPGTAHGVGLPRPTTQPDDPDDSPLDSPADSPTAPTTARSTASPTTRRRRRQHARRRRRQPDDPNDSPADHPTIPDDNRRQRARQSRQPDDPDDNPTTPSTARSTASPTRQRARQPTRRRRRPRDGAATVSRVPLHADERRWSAGTRRRGSG
jgi:hypothetical protein